MNSPETVKLLVRSSTYLNSLSLVELFEFLAVICYKVSDGYLIFCTTYSMINDSLPDTAQFWPSSATSA